jgi:Flp pilus assembly protein TadG
MVSVLGLLRRWRSDSGAELIEFALVAPLLFLLVFGIFDVGLYFNRATTVTNAAREGARIASLPDKDDDAAKAVVGQYLTDSGLSVSDATIDVAPQALPDGSCGKTVRVTYPHAWFFIGGIMSYWGGMTRTPQILAQSTMRLEAAAPCP